MFFYQTKIRDLLHGFKSKEVQDISFDHTVCQKMLFDSKILQVGHNVFNKLMFLYSEHHILCIRKVPICIDIANNYGFKKHVF